MIFSEDSRVKIPCILHLVRLGYHYLSLKGASWDEETNIFPALFHSAITKINPEAALRTSIVIPPTGAIQKYEAKTAAIISKQRSILKENQQLAQLRDWLLPLLMNGQVAVK